MTYDIMIKVISMNIDMNVGISNRHVHLTEDDFKKLFNNKELEVVKYLNQPGQFASNLKVTIKTEKSEISGVRVLGPLRDYTQVEISKTDAYKLGLNPPVRESGNLKGSEDITIIGDNEITVKECTIIATRHIHASKEDLVKYNLDASKKYKVKINGEKGGIINNVSIKVSDKAFFEMHLDTDDGNGHLLKCGDTATIIGEDNE